MSKQRSPALPGSAFGNPVVEELEQARPAAPPDEPLLDKVLAATTSRLDGVATRYARALEDPTLSRLERAMMLAQGLQRLRTALSDDVMKLFMPLMNSDLGFKTDRPNKREPTPYGVPDVRECLIAALLQGVSPWDNEFNIIAGRCYIALNGYARKVRETPGLSDLRLSPGVPIVHNGQRVVRVAATWNYQGKFDQLMGGDGKPGRAFPIISYESSTADNIIGKAKRKALKAIYEQIHGSEHSLPDGEVDEVGASIPATQAEPTSSRTEAVADQLAAQAGPQREPGQEG